MAQDVNDVLYVDMQVVRKKLPQLFELSNTVEAMMSKEAEKFRISVTPGSSDFRAPLMIAPPTSFGTFSMAGGSLGVGGGFTTQQMVQTYFPLDLAVDVNYNAIVATSGGPALSTVNAWRENLKLAMPSFQRLSDASFHNTGGNNGQIGTSTALATATYTLDTANGADLIQINQPLEILSSDGNTWVTSSVSPDNLPYASVVDKINRKITLANTGGLSLNSGDQFFFRGALATGTPPTQTWLAGLRYWHTTSTSGSLGGLTKTSYDIMPNLVNVNGQISATHGWQVKAQVRQRRGEIPEGYRGILHDAQAAQLRLTGVAISENFIQNGAAFKNPDLGAGMGNDLTYWDIPHKIDIHQNKTIIDWLLPKDNWCRVYGEEPTFYKNPGNGSFIFEGRSSGGTVTAKFSFFIACQVNYLCPDPGKESVLYGCAIPSGF